MSNGVMSNSVMSNSVSTTVAEWIADLEPGDIPAPVRAACANTVLDTAGLTIAALDTDYGRAVRAAWVARGTCSVFGLADPVEMAAAAVINGTCGHGEDFDNTFEGCPVHSGVVLVPALIAAGEAFELSTAQVAKGLAVGMEVMCRLGLVANKGVHAAGFHPTAILGTLGAAAGVSAALGHDLARTRDALGVAGSMASGIIEYLADGSWTKRMHPGWSAQAGIRAAMMGGAGFAGPRTVLEGTHGLFRAFAPSLESPDFGLLAKDLGEHWASARVAFKPYACGTMAQPYVDCAVRLARHGMRAQDIVSMECDVGAGTVHRLWEPLASKQQPPTAYAAKFSVPYCVAVGFSRGDAGLAEFSDGLVTDPAILSLCRKVSYRVDPDNEYPRNYTGHIRATLVDGRVVEERQGQLRGGAREPLSRADLLTKCRANLVFAGRAAEHAESLAAFADALVGDDRALDTAVLRVSR